MLADQNAPSASCCRCGSSESEARYSTGERKEERDDAPEADARTEVLLDGRGKECRRSVCVVKGQKAGGQNSV